MKVLILGGDGYLGWPTATYFASQGHEVVVVDNYYRRIIAEATDSDPLFQNPSLTERCRLYKDYSNIDIGCRIGDLSRPEFMFSVFEEFKPDTIVHYAEQPSAPYSMRGFSEARDTFKNNLDVTFNVIWAMIKYSPKAHLIKLGTMGEYGTPDIDIPEGWIEIEKNSRKDKFLFPRAAGSLYHTTKVLDTDLLWFYVRTHGLSVTDLMQGPVYGLQTFETNMPEQLLPNFHYDDIFGTVVNRFLVQAVAEIPLTVYGKGGQTRGYLNLKDTLQCVYLAAKTPSSPGELRIYNQLTETFTVNDIAQRVVSAAKAMGIVATINSVPNPRKEKEEHYYNPEYSGLLQLGLEPNYMTEEVLCEMISNILIHKKNIKASRVMPRVKWS